MKQKILFITGSLNQTTQMQQIAAELKEFDCWFSQIFVDFPLFQWLIVYTHLASKTVLSGQFKENSENSAMYVGMALGKKVHSYFNRQGLEAQLPIQNDGKSAQNIA